MIKVNNITYDIYSASVQTCKYTGGSVSYVSRAVMTLRLGEKGVRAGISKGSYKASVIVFKKIKQSIVLSHHFHSIPAT